MLSLRPRHLKDIEQTLARLAIESDHITGDVVDVAGFPDMVRRYNVLAAPTVVVNATYHFYGALDEEGFVEHVLKATRLEG